MDGQRVGFGDEDEALVDELISEAGGLLVRDPPLSFDEAAEELAHVAAGRVDLLAAAAGEVLGSVALSSDWWPRQLLLGRMLIAAGADRDLLGQAVTTARRRWRYEIPDGEPLPDLVEVCASVDAAAPPVQPGFWDDDRF